MAIITAILEVQLTPDSLETARKVLHATLADTRAFPGCLGVQVLADEKDPAHFVIVETWESMDRDRAYRAWRSTPEGASDFGSVLAGPPRLSQFTVAEGI